MAKAVMFCKKGYKSVYSDIKIKTTPVIRTYTMFKQTLYNTRKEEAKVPELEKPCEYVEASTPDYIPKPEEPDEVECEDLDVC